MRHKSIRLIQFFILLDKVLDIDPNKIKGYIYKLCYDETSCVFYIGSTIRGLSRRLTEHKREIKNGKSSKKKIELFKDKVDELKMILLDECLGTIMDIRFRERYWLEKLKSIVNIVLPIRNKGEYDRLYYQNNKLKILAYRAEQIECDICGQFISRRHIARHKKSKRCIECLIE